MYKDVSGNSPCIKCPVDTYYGFFGATSSSNCTRYPDFSISSNGSTIVANCKYLPGYTRSATYTCTACATGKYKDFTGDDNCTSCLSSSSTQGSDSTSASACACNVGYTGPVTACAPCGTGLYKDTAGPSACGSCPGNTSTAATAAAVLQTASVCLDTRVRTAVRVPLVWLGSSKPTFARMHAMPVMRKGRRRSAAHRARRACARPDTGNRPAGRVPRVIQTSTKTRRRPTAVPTVPIRHATTGLEQRVSV
jgi:hypothetical protein